MNNPRYEIGGILMQMHEEQEREILLHKWFASEKVGRDVGYVFARIDWSLRHRRDWIAGFLAKHSKRLGSVEHLQGETAHA